MRALSNLPPGVTTSMIPGCGPEEPCALCGEFADDCTCPECKTCGAHGCLDHAHPNDLHWAIEQIAWRYDLLTKRLHQRQMQRCLAYQHTFLHEGEGRPCDNHDPEWGGRVVACGWMDKEMRCG